MTCKGEEVGRVKKRPVIIFDEGENLIFYGLNTKLSFPFRQHLNELKKGNINETRRRLLDQIHLYNKHYFGFLEHTSNVHDIVFSTFQ